MRFVPGLILESGPVRNRFPAFLAEVGAATPEHLDLRAELLTSSDQGNTPQCAAYAMAGLIEWRNWKQNGIKAQVDPVPIYDKAKQLDGHPDERGTTLEAVVNAAVALRLLPIDLSSLELVWPPNVKRALHKHGAMLAGFYITDGWREAKPDGWIPEGGDLLGGHAVVLVGYSEVETPRWYAVQNSWGESGYGWRGFCRMRPEQFAQEFMYGLVWSYK